MPKLRSWRTCSLVSVAILVIGLTSTTDVQASVSIYRRVLRSTGWVVVPSTDGVRAGTCFVVDGAHRLVLTCAHVLGKASEALVYFPQYRNGEAIIEASDYLNHEPALIGRVLAKDAARDLALLQLKELPSTVEALPLADHSPEPGEAVHSIGNSGLSDGGMLWRYTRGYVRLVYPELIQTDHGVSRVRVVETQSPVNKGDSGGPVVNAQCQVVGVIDSYAARERLVSENTDVLEVKDFLKKALGQKAQISLSGSEGLTRQPHSVLVTVVGSWKVTAIGANGPQLLGQGQLDRNGTFAFPFAVPGKQYQFKRGRYAYANGILWLISGNVNLLAPLSWSNTNEFAFQTDKGEVVFERQNSPSQEKTSGVVDGRRSASLPPSPQSSPRGNVIGVDTFSNRFGPSPECATANNSPARR
jgi:S1-C subfamily serine protease